METQSYVIDHISLQLVDISISISIPISYTDSLYLRVGK